MSHCVTSTVSHVDVHSADYQYSEYIKLEWRDVLEASMVHISTRHSLSRTFTHRDTQKLFPEGTSYVD